MPAGRWPAPRVALVVLAAIGGALAVIVGLQFIGKSPSAVAPSTSLIASPSAEASSIPSESVIPSSSIWVAPTARPNPETGTDLAWEQVAAFANAKNVSISDVAAGPGGYVAVGVYIDGLVTEIGFEGPSRPAIWRSADGLAWQEADSSAFGTRSPISIASDGTRYVTVAYDGDRSFLYRSTDGSNWQPIAAQPIVEGARVWDIVASNGGFGFIALAGRIDSGHVSIWGSSDGAAWAQNLEFFDGSEPTRLAIGRNEALAFGYGAVQLDQSIAPSLWVSASGSDWQRHDPPTAGRGGLDVAAPTSGGWFAAGYAEGVGIAVWNSIDGRSWSALPAQPELRTDYEDMSGSASGAFAFAGKEYLFGYTGCCGGPPQRSYVSADREHWARIPRDPAIATVHFGTVIVEGDRVVAIGNTHGSGGLGGTGGMWIGRVP